MHRGEVEKLEVRKKSMDLTDLLYKSTKSFPKDELFGITNQIRRAACSVPMNIAEGNGKKSNKEFSHYLHISFCSALEIETAIRIAFRSGYMNEDSKNKIIIRSQEVRRMLLGLKRSIE